MTNPNHYRLNAKARRRKRCRDNCAQNMAEAIYRQICKGLRAARKAGVDCGTEPINLRIEEIRK